MRQAEGPFMRKISQYASALTSARQCQHSLLPCIYVTHFLQPQPEPPDLAISCPSSSLLRPPAPSSFAKGSSELPRYEEEKVGR